MQSFNKIMIYYWGKKLKKNNTHTRKRLHVLEADIVKIEKKIDLMSLAERVYS